MHGLGVAVNTKLAWEYFARANFGSRHARLSRAEGAMLRLAKGVYEARALLLIGAALGLLVSSGRATDPFAMLRLANPTLTLTLTRTRTRTLTLTLTLTRTLTRCSRS